MKSVDYLLSNVPLETPKLVDREHHLVVEKELLFLREFCSIFLAHVRVFFARLWIECVIPNPGLR